MFAKRAERYASTYGDPYPTLENPEQILRKPRTLPPLPCDNRPHLVWTKESTDYSWDPSNSDIPIVKCEVQPCTNRHIVPTKEQFDPADSTEYALPSQENFDSVWATNNPRSHKPTPSNSKVPSRIPSPAPAKDPNPQPPAKPPPRPPSPPPPPSVSTDSDDSSDSDNDSDDDMSKAKKSFEGISKLAANGSNWSIWWDRVEIATKSIPEYGSLLAAAPSTADESAKAKDADLLNAIICLLPDSILHRYKAYRTSTSALVTALKRDYNVSNAIVEAKSMASLFTTKCDKESEVGKHLDHLVSIRESLARANKDISDEQFIDAIIATIPPRLSSQASNLSRNYTLFNALTGASDSAAKRLTIPELLQFIRAESAHNTTRKSGDSANFSTSSHSNFRGRGRGRGRGNSRGGRNSGHSSGSSSSSNSDKSRCHNCGGVGHWAPKCPSPKQRRNAANSADQAGDKPSQPSSSSPTSNKSTPSQPSTTPSSKAKGKPAATFAHIEEVEDYSAAAWSANPTDELEIDLAIWEATCPASIDVSDLMEDFPVLVTAGSDSNSENFDQAIVAIDSASAHNATEVFDSGCSRHMTPYGDSLSDYRTIPEQKIRAANAEHFSGIGVGNFHLQLPLGEESRTLLLKNVLHCPDLHSTLVSVSKLDLAGYKCVFQNRTCRVYNPSGVLVGIVPLVGGLYQSSSSSFDVAYSSSPREPVVSLYEAHCRLGHINYAYVKHLLKDPDVHGFKLDPSAMEEVECVACIKAKATRAPIAKERSSLRAANFGNLFHMDIWGPAAVRTVGHAVYSLTLIDDATLWLESLLLKFKYEAFPRYVAHATMLREQYQTAIKVLHSDRGGEFLSKAFTDFLASQGTIRKLTVHDTPQHNGVAERSHRTTLNGVRAVLSDAQLPHWLWGYALEYIVYVWNRTPKKPLGMKTPYELRFNSKPNVATIRRFGSLVFVTRVPNSKLAERAIEGRWLGLDPESNGHRIFWPDRRTITVERDVVFSSSDVPRLEGEYKPIEWDMEPVDAIPETAASENPSPTPDPIPVTPSDELTEISEPIDPNIITGKRKVKPSQKAKDIARGLAVAYVAQELALSASLADATATSVAVDPITLAEAMRQADWPKWEEAMYEEIERLLSRKAWVVVDIPPDANVIGCKWVFRTKRDAHGNIIAHRARLVAQGFTQVEGVDYFDDDTYAGVVRLATVRALLALAARNGWKIHQIDIKSAYLYGKLERHERIYMKRPPYVKIDGLSNDKILQLLVSIYGLKQSGRRWYKTFRAILEDQLEFTRSDYDHAVFYRHLPDGEVLIIFIHVDDTTLIAPDDERMGPLKESIKKILDVTDGGELHWLLGIEVRRDYEGLHK
ncbi:hypothetical protein NMY22_g11644 [Coprinellus aureogranulatus]|nr:hypothetical protein NMY22_g11644 [Coprinellus aureogranulatus]